MSTETVPHPDRLVKSTQRVRDLGEVFTPASTVDAMLDLLPDEMWNVHPSPTFLEPACGDGNFLVGILARKLKRVTSGYNESALPAGTGPNAAAFHALEALASIYAVDISPENIIGGTPGHEIGARQRLLQEMQRWHERAFDKPLPHNRVLYKCALWIVTHNVQVGNMLAFDSSGRSTGREMIPLLEYGWDVRRKKLTISSTTLGDVMTTNEVAQDGLLSLFEPPTPVLVWEGRATNVHEANLERIFVLPNRQKVGI